MEIDAVRTEIGADATEIYAGDTETCAVLTEIGTVKTEIYARDTEIGADQMETIFIRCVHSMIYKKG